MSGRTRLLWAIAAGTAIGVLALALARWLGETVAWLVLLVLLAASYVVARRRGPRR